MSPLNRIDEYLYDREYKIILKDHYLNIINYTEIVDFSLNQIRVKIVDKLLTIIGTKLTISKMQDNEVLIIGNIDNISIK